MVRALITIDGPVGVVVDVSTHRANCSMHPLLLNKHSYSNREIVASPMLKRVGFANPARTQASIFRILEEQTTIHATNYIIVQCFKKKGMLHSFSLHVIHIVIKLY